MIRGYHVNTRDSPESGIVPQHMRRDVFGDSRHLAGFPA
jgi:hypothetical protein